MLAAIVVLLREGSEPKLVRPRNLGLTPGIPIQRGKQDQETGIPRKDPVRSIFIRCGSIG